MKRGLWWCGVVLVVEVEGVCVWVGGGGDLENTKTFFLSPVNGAVYLQKNKNKTGNICQESMLSGN